MTMSGRALAQPGGLAQAESSLRQIRSLTQTSLAYLDIEDLLPLLLDRTLAMLQCDTAAILLLEPQSKQLVARAARGLEEELRQNIRVPLQVGFAGRIASERRPVVLDHVDSTTVSNPILWRKGISSMLGVPLITGGNLIGVLHVGSLQPRSFSDDEIMLLEVVADKVAWAVQAGIAQAERRAAGVLQRSLLPSALPTHPHVEFSSRYVPAERGDIGGDWYDAFEVPSGNVWAVAGDVAGHGLNPAVVMGRLRSAVRSYALLGMSPEDVLRASNRKLQHFEPDVMATVVCAVLAPPFNEFRICSAGHPPPVLVPPAEEPLLLDLRPAPPLGVVVDFETQSTRWDVVDGSMIVLYTDGLIERRGESLDDGLERLRSSVQSEEPDLLCARIMGTLVGDYEPADDIALLTVRVSPRRSLRTDQAPDEDGLAIVRSELFSCDPSSVRAARSFIAECVEHIGLNNLSNVQLMVSELTTNAVVHARSRFDITVEALTGGGARIEVRDFGSGRPELCDGEAESVAGRGLRIVDLLAQTWGVVNRSNGSGKATWFIVGR